MPASVSLSSRRARAAVSVAGLGAAVLTSRGDSASGSKDGSGRSVVECRHVRTAEPVGRRFVGAAHSTPNCR
ncbi:hypothetical protein OG698_45035 [Streptomyces sp. NBC_01003]|uniref:hypothetical protein n=1 Tax=Streptomyces sp. NBC_01003 TaxID=2903714 RepID=UPI00387092D2|nr:hypothetical protein OG698_45035 [Streptomyces sp. NBC_01003]